MGDDDEAERLHRAGVERLASGDREGAAAAFTAALAIDASRPTTLNNLATLRRAAGQHEEARTLYERALSLGSPSAALLVNAANNALDLGHAAEAERFATACVALHPRRDAGPVLLARALVSSGRAAEGLAVLEAARERFASSGLLWNALGLGRDRARDEIGSIAAFEQAVALLPSDAAVRANLGDALRRAKRLDEARAQLEASLAIDPAHVSALESMAALLIEVGACELAAEHAQRAAELTRGDARLKCLSMRLFALAHVDTIDPVALRAEHEAWGREAEGTVAPGPAPRAAPVALRSADQRRDRPRVVYLSPDFREHVVTRFVLPVLVAHDPKRIEVVLASTTKEPDAVTARLRSEFRFVDLGGMAAERAHAALEAIEADVVVELAGHSSDSVLPLLVRRVAAAQATWLGFPSTTGLATIDYRITDAVCDPEGTDGDFTEKLVRLERPAWAYVADTGLLGRSRTGDSRPTFGCFNRATKLGASVLALFARLLIEVPEARLVLRARVEAPSFRARVREAFDRAGVAPDRVEHLAEAASFEAVLASYQAIDVALDTFPYHGTTTTCDALTMGVPVVSLTGAWPASRVSRSLLGAVGLDDLAASSEAAFVSTAAALVRDPTRLQTLRRDLPERVRTGPLGDAPALANALEDAYFRLTKFA